MNEKFVNVMAEVQYDPDGEGNIHSDLPPDDRDLLHAALDEWLNRSNGSGFFFVGDVEALRAEFGESE